MLKRFVGCIVLLSATSVFGADKAADKAKEEQIQLKVAMNKIYQSLQELLPLSIEPGGFKHATQQKKVKAALQTLSTEAKWIRQHAAPQDQGFAFLSESLASDATGAYRHFTQGRTAESQFLIRHVTENCIACHSRLPSSDAHPSKTLFTKIDAKRFNKDQRALLLIATRQFDDAMKTFEDMFNDPTFLKSQAVLLNPFLDYLSVAVRVRGDYGRARGTMEKVLAHGSLPDRIADDVRMWVVALKALEKNPPAGGDKLETAKALMANGKKEMEYPTDRSGLIYYLAASGLLNQYIHDDKPTDPKKLGEAYYLLGMAETVTGRSYWLSQTDRFLEAAIRTAPSAPYARKAFNLLEENIVMGYSGSSGTHIPADVQAKLKELGRLVRGDQAKSK